MTAITPSNIETLWEQCNTEKEKQQNQAAEQFRDELLAELARNQNAVHCSCEYATGRLAFQMLKDAGWCFSPGHDRVIVAEMLPGDGDHIYGWDSGYWISNSQSRADAAANIWRKRRLTEAILRGLLIIWVLAGLISIMTLISVNSPKLHDKADKPKVEQIGQQP